MTIHPSILCFRARQALGRRDEAARRSSRTMALCSRRRFYRFCYSFKEPSVIHISLNSLSMTRTPLASRCSRQTSRAAKLTPLAKMQSHRCPTVVFPRLLQHGGRLLLAKPSMAARVQSFSRGYVSRIQGFGVFAASASNAIAPASASKSVLLVESPTKARKIQEYLGSDYAVIASYGHVRDLPSKSGSVDPDNDFHMAWTQSQRGRGQMREVQDALKDASRLLLATDPDREGEAIAWHAFELLQKSKHMKNVEVQRITFTEVTKKAVLDALAAPRQISQELVDAYLARRALDYLVGFNISPVLWRKLPGARSAGRVQSVALRLLSDREAEVEAFKAEQYWTVKALLETAEGQMIAATLTKVDGKRIGARGFDSKEEAISAVDRLRATTLEVSQISRKDTRRNPSPPFTTSTMQQDAARRMGMSASSTMRSAQSLYEGEGVDGDGLITYHRTDGVSMSPSAVDGIRQMLQENYGKDYVSPTPKAYKTKAKNAQEAHEAIRPVDAFCTPESLPAHLDSQQQRLYRLIWQRAVASQASSAVIEQVGVDILGEDGALVLRSTGSVVKFPGFLAIYGVAEELDENTESSDDEVGQGASNGKSSETKGEEARLIGYLQKGQLLKLTGKEPITEHWTKPPPRFNEGSLVKSLEELGIGRPSTYAPTIKLLQDRKYVAKDGRTLVPSSLGRVLSAFLTTYFEKYVDFGFTAALEADLDNVAAGNANWRQILGSFWEPFCSNVDSTKDISVTEVIDVLDEALGPHLFPEASEPSEDGPAADPRKCPACGTGRLGLKLSRQGGFIGCSNFSNKEIECRYVRQLGTADGLESMMEGGRINAQGHIELGIHPETNQPITIRVGPYGPYLQMDGKGASEDSEKPTKTKRAAIPKGMEIADVTLEMAIDVLKLPQEIGVHPDDGLPIELCNGPFGYYVKHDEVSANLRSKIDPWTLELETAVDLLDAKRKKLAIKAEKEGSNKSSGKDAAGPKSKSSKAKAKKGSAKASGTKETAKAKKAPSGYILFCTEQRKTLLADKPGLSFGEVSKELGAMWKALDDNSKERFLLQAEKLAQEHAGSDESKPKSKAKGTTSRNRSSKGGGSTRTLQESEEGPKKPLSAYILYCREERPRIIAENPELSFGEVAKMLGSRWKSLDPETKDAFKKLAAEDAVRYKELTGAGIQ